MQQGFKVMNEDVLSVVVLRTVLISGKLIWIWGTEECSAAISAAVSSSGNTNNREGWDCWLGLSPLIWVPVNTGSLSPLLPHRYYIIYDSGDRHYLFDAYNDGDCFSLTIPFNPKVPNLWVSQLRLCSWAAWLPSRHRLAHGSTHTGQTNISCSSFSPRSSLFEYFKNNRNMKNLKDPSACRMGKIGQPKGVWRGQL